MNGVSNGTPFIKWRLWDFEHSPAVRLMSGEARAVYERMLHVQAAYGDLPDDVERCARFLEVKPSWLAEVWDEVRPQFHPVPDKPGWMENVRMCETIIEWAVAQDARREGNAEGGRRSGVTRAAKARAARERWSEVNPSDSTVPTQTKSTRSQTNEIEREKEKECSLRSHSSVFGENATGASFLEQIEDEEKREAPAVVSAPLDLPKAAPRSRLPLFSGKPAKAGKPKYAETPEDRAAWAILDAAWPVVSAHVSPIIGGVDRWRQRNKQAALDFAADGFTPERVVALIEAAYRDGAGYYATTTALDTFARNAATILDAKKGARQRRGGGVGSFGNFGVPVA